MDVPPTADELRDRGRVRLRTQSLTSLSANAAPASIPSLSVAFVDTRLRSMSPPRTRKRDKVVNFLQSVSPFGTLPSRDQEGHACITPTPAFSVDTETTSGGISPAIITEDLRPARSLSTSEIGQATQSLANDRATESPEQSARPATPIGVDEVSSHKISTAIDTAQKVLSIALAAAEVCPGAKIAFGIAKEILNIVQVRL